MSRYKRYPAYKDSGVEWIGEVPEYWEVKRLRHIAQFSNSNVDKKSYEGQQAVKLCNYTDVYYNEFITTSLPFMDATASQDEIRAFELKKGDVLITKDSEDPLDIGIPAIVTDDMAGVICGYHLTMIRTNAPDGAGFVHRSIQSHPTTAHFFVESPGITRYGLSQDAIGDIVVCLPPKGERERLASWVNNETARIDALIAKKTRFIELLKEKRQALITHAVTKGLDPKVKTKDSGVEWIGAVAQHWSFSKLAYVATERGGKTPTTSTLKYWDGDVPWVSPKDMKVDVVSDSIDKITEVAVKEFGMVKIPPQSILVVVRGMILAHSFPVAETSRDVTINQDMKALAPAPGLCPSYLRLLLQSAKHYVVNVLVAEAAHGTRVLRTDIWKQMPLFVPPVDEQNSILTYIANATAKLDALASASKRSMVLLKERRSALITAAVTGKIDLREAI